MLFSFGFTVKFCGQGSIVSQIFHVPKCESAAPLYLIIAGPLCKLHVSGQLSQAFAKTVKQKYNENKVATKVL